MNNSCKSLPERAFNLAGHSQTRTRYKRFGCILEVKCPCIFKRDEIEEVRSVRYGLNVGIEPRWMGANIGGE